MSEPLPTLRQRKAQLTRDEILTAARRLFAERGYAGTSVRAIARAAGVSAQTVYDSVGSKQAVVAQLNDLLDQEAGIAALAATASRSQDPDELTAINARISRSILEHAGDIVHALISGAAAEPALAAALEEGQRRHLAGTTMIVGRLDSLDALAPGMSTDAAVDTLAALSDVRVSHILHHDYGWTLDRIESWTAGASRALLLAPTRAADSR